MKMCYRVYSHYYYYYYYACLHASFHWYTTPGDGQAVYIDCWEIRFYKLEQNLAIHGQVIEI